MTPLVALAFLVQATIVGAYDGDTLTVDAYPWPGMTIRETVRLEGVDTPEIRGKCPEERTLAKRARDTVRRWIGQDVMLEFDRRGKYGRLLARVILPDGRDLGVLLVTQGLARVYDGGKRQGWCGVDQPDGPE